MATNLWTADRRLYLNADGKAVEADDPTRQSLLVAQGGTIPLADAEKYGLVTIVPAQIANIAPAPEEKAKAAPTNKAKAAPENK